MADSLVGCPLGVIAGEPIVVKVGCPAGYQMTVSVAGVFTNFVSDPITGTIIIPTQTASSQAGSGAGGIAFGFVDVTVTCTPPPDSGLDTIVETCSTEVIDPNEYLDCDESEPCWYEVVHCKVKCYCASVTINAINCEPVCTELSISGATAGAYRVPPPEEVCPPALQPVALEGTKPAWLPEDIEEEFLPEWCEEDGLFCEPHKAILIWNNLCRCPGWTVSGAGIDGTDASFACCLGGSPWKAAGAASMIASGPPQGTDIAYVWGHNILDGQVTTSPAPFGGGSKTIALCYDDACIDGFTRPLIIPLDGLTTTGAVSMSITGTTVDGGPICIEHMGFARKLELPDDALRVGFVNPHNACGTEVETKKNDCGDVLQVITRRKEVPLALNLRCVNEEWVKRYWRSYLRYVGDNNPVIFQWSINRCENDMFFGYKTNASSNYSSSMYQDLTLEASGYTQQRQPKAFA